MRRIALLVVPTLTFGCTAHVRVALPEPPAVTVGVSAQAQPPPPPDPAAAGVTVDVDAEPIAAGDPEEVTATTEPPDPVYEEQTDSPNPGYVWVNGYWGWNGVDWGWNWGRWAAPPTGQVYIEPYYERVGGSVVYVRGYWGPHDAPRRSYGGDRIRFTAAVRPANYHRGEHVVVEHRAGPPPGKRPGGAYEHATGSARPLPKATAPAHRMAAAHETATPRENAHEGTAGHEAGHEAAAHETGHVGSTESHEVKKGAEPAEKSSHPVTSTTSAAHPAQAQPKKEKDKEKR